MQSRACVVELVAAVWLRGATTRDSSRSAKCRGKEPQHAGVATETRRIFAVLHSRSQGPHQPKAGAAAAAGNPGRASAAAAVASAADVGPATCKHVSGKVEQRPRRCVGGVMEDTSTRSRVAAQGTAAVLQAAAGACVVVGAAGCCQPSSCCRPRRWSLVAVGVLISVATCATSPVPAARRHCVAGICIEGGRGRGCVPDVCAWLGLGHSRAEPAEPPLSRRARASLHAVGRDVPTRHYRDVLAVGESRVVACAPVSRHGGSTRTASTSACTRARAHGCARAHAAGRTNTRAAGHTDTRAHALVAGRQ